MFEQNSIDILGEPKITRAAGLVTQYNQHLVELMGRIQLASGTAGPEKLKETLWAVAALQKHLERNAPQNWVELVGALAENYVATIKWHLSGVEGRMSELRKSGATDELLQGLKEQKERLEEELGYPAYQVFSNVQPYSVSRYFGDPPKHDTKTTPPPKRRKAPKGPPREKNQQGARAALLSSPWVGIVLAFFFGACAFSGKFSISATRIFLGLTWAGMGLLCWETRTIRSRRSWYAGIMIISGIALGAFAKWLEPEIAGASTGIISPNRELFSSIHSVNPRFEIGQSGDIVEISGPSPAFSFLFSKDTSLRVEALDGKILVSTQIRDANGDLIAEIIRNEWKVAPRAWDRNYGADAFEVRNPKGKIVLQVRALPDRIQLQGEWPTNNGQFIRLVASPKSNAPVGSRGLILRYDGKNDSGLPEIKPLFQYPSDRHLGQLAHG